MSSKFAVFVDAGYLLAASGMVVAKSPGRGHIECNYRGIIDHIETLAMQDGPGHSRLRTYWYDGAKAGVPSPDQVLVSDLSYVKLRLGRLNAKNEQKGVDSLIYRDIMTLARERAIERAYLVSGDEDLRQGVIAAQDMGVQVVLVGIGNSTSPNQSEELAREVDHRINLPDDQIRKFVTPRPSGASQGIGASTKSTTTSIPSQMSPAVEEKVRVQADEIGAKFAAKWLKGASSPAVAAIREARPRIPQEIDGPLLESAHSEFGSSIERGAENAQVLRKAVRAGFWGEIEKAAAAAVPPATKVQ